MAGPILNGLRRVGGFFLNYARKATATGGVGGALMPALLSAIPEDAPESLLSQIADWPIWLQAIAFFAVFFATTYFPPNRVTPEA